MSNDFNVVPDSNHSLDLSDQLLCGLLCVKRTDMTFQDRNSLANLTRDSAHFAEVRLMQPFIDPLQ